MSRRLLEILEDCKSRGISLKARTGDELEVNGPLESLPELREDLKKHKSNLLHYLRTGNCHHELEPKTCAVCSGYVRRLIESEAS